MRFVQLIVLIMLTFAGSGIVAGEANLAQSSPVSICELAKHPTRYASTMIIVEGVIDKARHGIWLSQEGCEQSLLLNFPDQVNLDPPADFALERDSRFEQFQKALYDFKPGTTELKNAIKATIEGRFDSVCTRKNGKRTRITLGYGEHNLAQRRLVMRRITQIVVTMKE